MTRTYQVIIMMVVCKTICAADFVKTDKELRIRDLKKSKYDNEFSYLAISDDECKEIDDNDEENLPCHSLISLEVVLAFADLVRREKYQKRCKNFFQKNFFCDSQFGGQD